MKPKTLPLPTPWNSDAAVLHLYRVWSARGRVQLRQIALLNPHMVSALKTLWRQNAKPVQGDEEVSGVLPGIGSWRLLQEQDGSGSIIIEHEA